jgi:hypothetical protein
MPKALATSAVDRLLHHAHLIITDGPSRRLAEATAGKGVKPLATSSTATDERSRRIPANQRRP